MDVDTKTCTKCNKTLPKTTLFFMRREGVADGFYPRCKACHSAAQKKKAPRQVLENSLTGVGYAVKSKLRNLPYTDAVVKTLEEHPERSNRWIAQETLAPYNYVNQMRKRLEEKGQIPFVTEWMNEKGDWRRRLIHPKRASDPWGRQPVVYFIRYEGIANSPVKIGRSDQMSQRLADYRLHNGLPLEILLVVEGDSGFEADIHALFHEDRLHGEWFRPSDRLWKFMDEIRHREVGNDFQATLEEHRKASPYHDPSYKKKESLAKAARGGRKPCQSKS